MSNNEYSNMTTDNRVKIKKALVEMNDSLDRIQAERDYQKDVVDKIVDETGIDKKIFKRMAKTYNKGSFATDQADNDAFESAYQLVIAGATV